MKNILLAIDDVSLPLRKNLCLYLSSPTVRSEPVLRPERGNPEAPDNAAAQFYGAVLHDGGKYRMWYYADHFNDGPNNGNPLDALEGPLVVGPVCYAESDDGINWSKPVLGQVDWRGNCHNNIIRLDTILNEGVYVIKDEEEPDPARRYKLAYNDWQASRNFWTIRTAVSPDGLHWTVGPELPYDGFIEPASLYKFNGCYYVNGQMNSRSEGGHHAGRQALAVVSPDFVHWLPECGESFLLPEPADPNARGSTMPYDQVHIGVGATSFGNVLVGLYCIWHNEPFQADDVDWFGMGTSSGDFGLVISNDGLHFREPVKGHVFLHRDDSRPQVPDGVRYQNVLCQGNGILNVGDETLIYHGRWANTVEIEDFYAEIALATLPRDRWGALGLFPDADEGSVWTAPVTLPAGCDISLNADGAAGMRVEVADERFNLLSSFSGTNAGTVSAPEGLDCPVVWDGRSLDALCGRTVRFRVKFDRSENINPRLFALYVSD